MITSKENVLIYCGRRTMCGTIAFTVTVVSIQDTYRAGRVTWCMNDLYV